MEYLILFAALLIVGLLVFFNGVKDERQRNKRQLKKLQESFGLPSDKEYADGEEKGIPRYFERHQERFALDDITWNDLNMDELFLRMNSTLSSAGQEYLYYMLRTPVFEKEELMRRDEIMSYFAQNEKERLKVQKLYWGMGRTGKYSIYDYLDFLDNLGERSSFWDIVLNLCFLPVIGLIAFLPQAGIVALMLLLCVNISLYMKQKSVIEPYLVVFKYVFRTLNLSEQLVKEQIPALEEDSKQLAALLSRFKKLKRSASFGTGNMGSSGNPLEILVAYLNMIFHLDIIGFNRMLKNLREQTDDIDELLTIVGRIDALIAAASFRESLPAFCKPEFSGKGMDVKGLYHPQLTEPVKNDISTDKGVLVTGSNASGKSTFLKAAAVNAILAQTMDTCCADFWKAPMQRVMTSMALRDDIQGGESYYIVEIKSLKRILDAVNEEEAPVLCFVDEVLRGTNTVERIAASTQILKSLHRENVLCFAATHDIELTELLEKEYDNYHFEEVISDGDIHFPYKLFAGRAKSRNAIRLLAMMGYEETIIAKADDLAAHFLESGSWN